MPTDKHSIHERSEPVIIKKKINSEEYSLKLNFFDPSKHSPPNIFMKTLHCRMEKYYKDVNKDCKHSKE